MQIEQIDEHIIREINAGDEKAFSKLYEAYYVYLNSIAIYYVIDSNIGGEVVDDVFMNIWNRKHPLVYPVHSYLIRSVQNGCLNYLRSQQAQQQVYDEHKERFLSFYERHILSTPVPLQYVEMRETENQIRVAVDRLPSQCRAVFEAYFYSGKSVDIIADEFQISISTVRVQLKKAIDRLKSMLKHLLIIFFV
ncbi:MAG: RNA polymerase sigma-70 factor [Tannerellaceae bacterium]|jgi:RNA polymerase sigma-70 factor (family 1)|nr:RNA polymerase sigma-70 factor [Tannerellaceae bacterium]